MNMLSPCLQRILYEVTVILFDNSMPLLTYDYRVVTLLAEHTMNMLSPCSQSILFSCGRLPHIHFHVCVLHLKNIHTIVLSLQNILGVHSLQQLAFRVCIMAITRAGAIVAAAKAVSKSRKNEKRRKSAARTRKQSEIRQTNRTGHAEGCACLSEERQSDIRQTNRMGHAEGRACLSAERRSEIRQTDRTGHAEVFTRLSEEHNMQRGAHIMMWMWLTRKRIHVTTVIVGISVLIQDTS